MIIDFQLIDTDIFCASLAEGPGGFIHCLNDFMIQKDITIHKCYGITYFLKIKELFGESCERFDCPSDTPQH